MNNVIRAHCRRPWAFREFGASGKASLRKCWVGIEDHNRYILRNWKNSVAWRGNVKRRVEWDQTEIGREIPCRHPSHMRPVRISGRGWEGGVTLSDVHVGKIILASIWKNERWVQVYVESLGSLRILWNVFVAVLGRTMGAAWQTVVME